MAGIRVELGPDIEVKQIPPRTTLICAVSQTQRAVSVY